MGKERKSRGQERGNNGLLGWCRKALSAYTWCRTNKGPQNEWLFKIKKADTDRCTCGERMTPTHVVEECPELNQWRPRGAVWKEGREALGGRAVSKKKKEEEEEGDLLGAFFYRIYEFLFSFTDQTPVIHKPTVPDRYLIKFVPASSVSAPAVNSADSPSVITPVIASPVATASPVVPVIVAATDYSVISSANFVPVSAFSSCIGSTL